MMEFGTVTIFVKAGNRTGLSALSGDEVINIGKMPQHLVEVHLFGNADAAAAFVDGLLTAGLGNKTAFDWEPGSTASNRCVLVARFDEPRREASSPEGAVKVVDHLPTSHDGAAFKRSMDAIHAARDAERKRQNEAVRPVREALHSLDPSDESWGPRWYRCSFPDGQCVTVVWKDEGGPYDISSICAEAGEGFLDLSEMLVSTAAEQGVAYDPDDREFRKSGLLAKDLCMAVRDISAVEEQCLAVRKAAYHESFMSRMKMTASRRRFLEAGRESGIRGYVNRGNRKARAGGVEIGAAEIDALSRAGWIESAAGGYSVTNAGAEALKTAARSRADPRP